jgi:amidase
MSPSHALISARTTGVRRLSGVPQISVPGAAVNGLSVGLSIVGGRGSDTTLVAVAAALTTA